MTKPDYTRPLFDYEFDEALKSRMTTFYGKYKKGEETMEEFIKRNLYPLRRYLRQNGYLRYGTGCWRVKKEDISNKDIEDFFNQQ